MGFVPLNDAHGYCLPCETSPPVAWKENRKEKENEALMGAGHVVLKLLAASSVSHPCIKLVCSLLGLGWAEGHCCAAAGDLHG